MFADIILPVPLQGMFTYAVPEAMAARVGCRVLVQFGRTKNYVGIVARLHDVKPEGYEVKAIQQLLDSEPIVTEQQLRLWQWMSDYYMSPIGDVYKAALPSGLKAEDGYRPKTETYIRLTEPYRNEAALHAALNVLARAKKQLDVFICYLELSGWDQVGSEELRMKNEELAAAIPSSDDKRNPSATTSASTGNHTSHFSPLTSHFSEVTSHFSPLTSHFSEVTREELLNVSGASADALNQLVKRKMLET